MLPVWPCDFCLWAHFKFWHLSPKVFLAAWFSSERVNEEQNLWMLFFFRVQNLSSKLCCKFPISVALHVVLPVETAAVCPLIFNKEGKFGSSKGQEGSVRAGVCWQTRKHFAPGQTALVTCRNCIQFVHFLVTRMSMLGKMGIPCGNKEFNWQIWGKIKTNKQKQILFCLQARLYILYRFGLGQPQSQYYIHRGSLSCPICL